MNTLAVIFFFIGLIVGGIIGYVIAREYESRN